MPDDLFAPSWLLVIGAAALVILVIEGYTSPDLAHQVVGGVAPRLRTPAHARRRRGDAGDHPPTVTAAEYRQQGWHALSERSFGLMVETWAKLRGWSYHTFNSQHSAGGFPTTSSCAAAMSSTPS